MAPQEMVDYWLITADHSWKTTQNLFEKRDCVDALFQGHLSLEKVLKATPVRHTQKDAPFRKKCNKKFCQTELDETEKFGKWIRKQSKP